MAMSAAAGLREDVSRSNPKLPPGKLYEPLAPFANKLKFQSPAELREEMAQSRQSQKPLFDFLRMHQDVLMEPVEKLAQQVRPSALAKATGLGAGVCHTVSQHELGHALLATLNGSTPWMVAGVKAPFGLLGKVASGQVSPMLGEVHVASPHAAKGVLMTTLAGLAATHQTEVAVRQWTLRPNLLKQVEPSEQAWVEQEFVRGSWRDLANFAERHQKLAAKKLLPPMTADEQDKLKTMPFVLQREGALLSPKETYLLSQAQTAWAAEMVQLPTTRQYLAAVADVLNQVPPETMTAMSQELHQQGLLYGARRVEEFFAKHLGRDALTALRHQHAKVVADLPSA
jgi:hypothetical protein